MRTTGYRNKIGGAILALSLVFGIGMIASTTAQAQDRNDGRWRRGMIAIVVSDGIEIGDGIATTTGIAVAVMIGTIAMTATTAMVVTGMVATTTPLRLS